MSKQFELKTDATRLPGERKPYGVHELRGIANDTFIRDYHAFPANTTLALAEIFTLAAAAKRIANASEPLNGTIHIITQHFDLHSIMDEEAPSYPHSILEQNRVENRLDEIAEELSEFPAGEKKALRNRRIEGLCQEINAMEELASAASDHERIRQYARLRRLEQILDKIWALKWQGQSERVNKLESAVDRLAKRNNKTKQLVHIKRELQIRDYIKLLLQSQDEITKYFYEEGASLPPAFSDLLSDNELLWLNVFVVTPILEKLDRLSSRHYKNKKKAQLFELLSKLKGPDILQDEDLLQQAAVVNEVKSLLIRSQRLKSRGKQRKAELAYIHIRATAAKSEYAQRYLELREELSKSLRQEALLDERAELRRQQSVLRTKNQSYENKREGAERRAHTNLREAIAELQRLPGLRVVFGPCAVMPPQPHEIKAKYPPPPTPAKDDAPKSQKAEERRQRRERPEEKERIEKARKKRYLQQRRAQERRQTEREGSFKEKVTKITDKEAREAIIAFLIEENEKQEQSKQAAESEFPRQAGKDHKPRVHIYIAATPYQDTEAVQRPLFETDSTEVEEYSFNVISDPDPVMVDKIMERAREMRDREGETRGFHKLIAPALLELKEEQAKRFQRQEQYYRDKGDALRHNLPACASYAFSIHIEGGATFRDSGILSTNNRHIALAQSLKECLERQDIPEAAEIIVISKEAAFLELVDKPLASSIIETADRSERDIFSSLTSGISQTKREAKISTHFVDRGNKMLNVVLSLAHKRIESHIRDNRIQPPSGEIFATLDPTALNT